MGSTAGVIVDYSHRSTVDSFDKYLGDRSVFG